MTLSNSMGTPSDAHADLASPPAPQPGLIGSEFIDDAPAVPSCHASTIAQSGDVLVAAWFAGTREKHPDVGIWIARRGSGGWSKPIEVANGVQPDGSRHPCWNPVLFQPSSGPLLLFFKVGPDPKTWWGMLMTSADAGQTWSAPRRLPDGVLGPIKNKPVELPGGMLLCPSSTEHDGWKVHFERTPDLGQTWSVTGPLQAEAGVKAIQPTLLSHASNGGSRLQLLCRTNKGFVYEAWSDDAGRSWSPLRATDLVSPNSGLDAVTLRDGRHLLVFNHTPTGRTPLNLAVSTDGQAWRSALTLEREPGEYSYPAIIQTPDGLVHVTYTWRRQRIRHLVIDPRHIVAAELSPATLPVAAPKEPK